MTTHCKPITNAIKAGIESCFSEEVQAKEKQDLSDLFMDLAMSLSVERDSAKPGECDKKQLTRQIELLNIMSNQLDD